MPCGRKRLGQVDTNKNHLGEYTLDSGKVELNGEDQSKNLSPINANQKRHSGNLSRFFDISNLSVMENLAYNSELMQNRKIVNWKRLRKIAEEAIKKIDFAVDLDAKVGDVARLRISNLLRFRVL